MYAPAMFISHGSPAFALDPGVAGAALRRLGAALTGLEAVLVVSPHWMTPSLRVMTTERPATIHDFGGFPAALYELRYPAPGAPELADEAARLLSDAGFAPRTDKARGYDHGAWVPLLHLLPGAKIPAFQVSLPDDLTTAGAFALGRALRPLREKGVMIIGSGSITHNLREVFAAPPDNADYAHAFVDWIREKLAAAAFDDLVEYRAIAPFAARAHPTEDHYLPLLVGAGAAFGDEPATIIEGQFDYGVLSMDSYAWGAPSGAV